jgi:hypothetical protein
MTELTDPLLYSRGLSDEEEGNDDAVELGDKDPEDEDKDEEEEEM